MVSGTHSHKIIGLAVLVSTVVLAACGAAAEPVQQPDAVSPAEDAAPIGEAPAAPAVDEGPAAPLGGEAPPESCIVTDPHPIAQSIADTYETATYDQVVTWFCDGSTFDDILLALETNAQTGTVVEDLLVLRAAGTEWDQIWQDIGFVE